jgi:hypothetical protein
LAESPSISVSSTRLAICVQATTIMSPAGFFGQPSSPATTAAKAARIWRRSSSRSVK